MRRWHRPDVLLEIAGHLVPGRLDHAIANLERLAAGRITLAFSRSPVLRSKNQPRSISVSSEGTLRAVAGGAPARPAAPSMTKRSPAARADWDSLTVVLRARDVPIPAALDDLRAAIKAASVRG
jgi:hypothetical protein